MILLCVILHQTSQSSELSDKHCSESIKPWERNKEKKVPLVLHLFFPSKDSSVAFCCFPQLLSLSPPFTHLIFTTSTSINEVHCSYSTEFSSDMNISCKILLVFTGQKPFITFILNWVLLYKSYRYLNLKNEPWDINTRKNTDINDTDWHQIQKEISPDPHKK